MYPDCPKWFQDVIILENLGKQRKALDLLFKNIDELLRNGKYEEVDEFLDGLEYTYISFNSIEIIIGVLSITFMAREKLKNRKRFFHRVKVFIDDIIEHDGKFEMNTTSEEILKGLE